jgi:hypothetical protein
VLWSSNATVDNKWPATVPQQSSAVTVIQLVMDNVICTTQKHIMLWGKLGQLNMSVLSGNGTQSQWACLCIPITACCQHVSCHKTKHCMIATFFFILVFVLCVPSPKGDQFSPMQDPSHASIKSHCILQHLTVCSMPAILKLIIW